MAKAVRDWDGGFNVDLFVERSMKFWGFQFETVSRLQLRFDGLPEVLE